MGAENGKEIQWEGTWTGTFYTIPKVLLQEWLLYERRELSGARQASLG